MAEQFKMDITGWEKKVRNVKEVQARICQEVVTWGLDQLFKKTRDHVHGPYYGLDKGRPIRGPLTNAGRLPIPVVTGALERSIKTIRFNTVFGAVWSDPRAAPHNTYVHFGKKGMKPRPFLQAAVDSERPRILEFMTKRILSEVQKVGGQQSFGF